MRLTILLLSIAGCCSLRAQTVITKKVWQLSEVRGGKRTETFKGKFTLSFSDSTFQAVMCYPYYGKYRLSGDTILTSQIPQNDQNVCGPEERAAESYLRRAIPKAVIKLRDQALFIEKHDSLTLIFR